MSERKTEILQNAIEIIATQGYGHLTLRALARASGIKLGALQSHFSNREELLRSLTDFIASEYRESLSTLEQFEDSLSVHTIARWYFQDAGGARLQSDGLWPQLFAMSRVEPLMKELLDGIYREAVALFEGYLLRAGSTNPRAEALALMSLVEGSTFLIGEGSPWEKDADQLMSTVLNAIEARYGSR